MHRLDLHPVGGALGVEVRNLDLNDLGEGEVDAILDAFHEHMVLFFPGQELTPEGHRRFGAIFGELQVVEGLDKLDEERYPEIVLVDSRRTPTADVWHTDVTYSPTPPVGSILHMIECPPVGGDTQFINLALAYDTLSEPMKDMLDGLTAIHANTYGEGHAEHPVVRVHPKTGRKSLYVNRIFTSHIRQLSRPESDHLLPFLYRWCEQSRFQVRWRWSPGDVAMWDNRTTLHNVVNDFDETRVLQRITVLGDKPVGLGEPRWDKHEPERLGASNFYGHAFPF